MHARRFASLLLAGLIAPLFAQTSTSRNASPFQNFKMPPSATIRFLTSERGREMLRRAQTPRATELLRMLGESAPTTGTSPLLAPDSIAPSLTLSSGCGTANGTRFNLEGTSNALPQNEESLDVILNRAGAGIDLVLGGANDYRGLAGLLGGSTTGYYVHRATTGCTVQAEGGLPAMADPNSAGSALLGGGDPVVAADPARDAFFMADLRFDNTTTGVGVFRTTAAKLLSTTSCPSGTESGSGASACWPARQLVAAKTGTFQDFFQDKPHLAVDERASGTGAGNVYVSGTLFDFVAGTSRIWIASCTNSLSSCSAPMFVSGTDGSTQMSHMSVRPDGALTVTWINMNASGTALLIRYTKCSAVAAPALPTCSSPVTVWTESNAILGFLGANDLRIMTYPKHVHRITSSGITTYIVWDRCKVPPIFGGSTCPDADVVISSSSTGTSWSTPVSIDTASGSQYFPWIAVDKSTGNLLVAYYSATDSYRHRPKVMLAQIPPGSSTPTSRTTVTSSAFETDADPFVGGFFIGDYIGVAARGTSVTGQTAVYIGFTFDVRKASYSGSSITQQDNWIAKVTY